MTPGSFDPDTCRSVVGDARARDLEADARATAESGAPLVRPPSSATSYWGAVQEEMEWRVRVQAHAKRTERIARKAAADSLQ